MKEITGLWVPIEILSDDDLTPTEKLVAAEIYILAPCNASNNHIGNILNINKRQVMRIIKNLEEKGWIKTTYLSPVRREINTTKNVTSDKSGSTKNVTHYQKCHYDTTKNVTSDSDKSGTDSTKNVTLDNRDNNKNIVEDNARAREAAADKEYAKVVESFESNIHFVETEAIQNYLVDLYESYGATWLIKAIEEAAISNVRSLKYINKILIRWKTLKVKEPWKVPRNNQTNNEENRPRPIYTDELRKRDEAAWM